jgi:hypothetical protein
MLLTRVFRDCEICSKFKFISSQGVYLNRKNSFTKFTTSQSTNPLANIVTIRYHLRLYA